MHLLDTKLSQLGTPTTCPIALILRDGTVLMGKRNYSPEFSVWTLPGGRCEEGETLEMTVRREVREEVGITDLEIIDFIAEIPGHKEGDVVPIFFCASNQEAILMEPDKFSEWRWFTLEEYTRDPVYNPTSRKVVIAYLQEHDHIEKRS